MALLGRNQILDAKDLQTEDVPVPEWGGEVRIRMLTGEERDAYEASMVELKKDGSAKANRENVRARLLILCIVNEAGEQMFNRADIKLLGRKSAKALERVINKVNEMNGISEKDIEELAEGFDNAPSEDSTSD
jgi:hypothetical protein